MMSGDQRRSLGFWADIVRYFRLAWRLWWDRRVPAGAKLVPVLAVIYLLSPVDFVPDWLLGLGQLDDLGALVLGVRLFVHLAPPEIVAQHLEAMGFPVNRWREVDEELQVIDAEYEVKEE